MERERVTVQEAAHRLSLTESAIRKRIRKGQIPHDKESDGRVYVYLERYQTGPVPEPESSYALLVERLENENEFLRRELERKDAILMNMTESIKALRAPAEPEQEEEPPEDTGGPENQSSRPWWRRWFGG